jgi:hypothetical protein
VVKGGVEGPLFGWIKIGLDSYGDPDGSTIIHFAVKVDRNARSLGALQRCCADILL